ncbi:MAG: acylphosphatase [Acidobacteria bacterium]|nr:acylphosphatase [Acidobacteriota bacterium]
MKRVHLIVHGRVQGVGFRWFTSTIAGRHNIHGFVRNLMDNTVEIDAEGPEERLQLFLTDIQAGPRFGYVDYIEKTSLPPKGYTSFDISR